jgi:predicted short-subunit dehydrogenase-like oxidoreductase (DUF2520 family)
VRQAPFKYLLVGNGRLAIYLKDYFEQKNITFTHWCRSHDSLKTLNHHISSSTHVLLAISDDSLENFILEHQSNLNGKTVVYFSGALYLRPCQFDRIQIFGMHPLMSFTGKRYGLDLYESINFICDVENAFEQVFPQLMNPSYFINPKQKSLYHALCVMSGNFTSLLWSSIESEFKDNLNLPKNILNQYKEQVFKNVLNDSKTSLTGPFVRGDTNTIKKNQLALGGHQMKDLYDNFYKLYKQKSSHSDQQQRVKKNKEANP